MYRFAAISFAALALACTLARASAAGDYQDSCSDTKILNGTQRSANCAMRDGRIHFGAFIDLNDYIANDDGTLVWRRGGNFGATCGDVNIIAPAIGRLGASCRSINGLTVFSFINLSERIANVNGDLLYDVELPEPNQPPRPHDEL